MQLVVADGLQQGFVVLVDEDGNALAGLLAGTANDTGKAQGKGCFGRFRTIKFFPTGEVIVQYLIQAVRDIVFFDVEVEV